MHSTNLPPDTRCPTCKGELNAASTGNKIAPRPDDISICWHCGAVLLFNHDLTMRLPSKRELAFIMQNPLVERLLEGRKQVKAKVTKID